MVSNEIGNFFQNSRPQIFRFQQVSEVEVLKAVKSINLLKLMLQELMT